MSDLGNRMWFSSFYRYNLPDSWFTRNLKNVAFSIEQEPAQIIYSHERIANGTTTQCVALLNNEDTLCVSFLATYNGTNAKVQLEYYAETQSSGQVVRDFYTYLARILSSKSVQISY